MNILKTIKTGFMAAALTAATVSVASADIIWDQSPDTTGASITSPNYTNISLGQNFAEHVTFASDGSLTGMDIYIGRTAVPNNDVVIKI